MEYNYKSNEKNKSDLQLKHIYVESIEFNRVKELGEEGKPLDLKVTYAKRLDKLNDDEYRLGLGCMISDGDDGKCLQLSVKMVGAFFIRNNSPDVSEKTLNEILEKNTVAIMFPFLRSQVTTLTAQPGMNTIVLPAMNINRLFEDKNEMIEDKN